MGRLEVEKTWDLSDPFGTNPNSRVQFLGIPALISLGYEPFLFNPNQPYSTLFKGRERLWVKAQNQTEPHLKSGLAD